MNALERLGRKRRARREQPSPVVPFSIESCDCVRDGAFALLRVAGTGSEPLALVLHGEPPQSFDPLPGPSPTEDAGMWRAAFAIPVEHTEPGVRLSLNDGKTLVELDLYAKPEAAAPPPPPAPAEDEEPQGARARKLVEAWSEAAHLKEKLADREEELADALKDLLAARKSVQPLKDKAHAAVSELATVREELTIFEQAAKEARTRATERATELDAARAVLTTATERADEASRVAEQAEAEAAGLREQVEQLQQDLTATKAELERVTEALSEQQSAHQSEVADQHAAAEKLESELTKLKDEKKNRRRSIGRRSEDKALAKVRTELEAKIAEQQQRIAELEQEATSFAERRDDAVADSLRERVGALEEEVRTQTSCADDLRALLDSERDLAVTARADAQELRQQLATATREAAPIMTAVPEAAPKPERAEEAKPGSDEPLPWTALDDELLARIEKAKALTS